MGDFFYFSPKTTEWIVAKIEGRMTLTWRELGQNFSEIDWAFLERGILPYL